jgi:hypothetical protein
MCGSQTIQNAHAITRWTELRLHACRHLGRCRRRVYRRTARVVPLGICRLAITSRPKIRGSTLNTSEEAERAEIEGCPFASTGAPLRGVDAFLPPEWLRGP